MNRSGTIIDVETSLFEKGVLKSRFLLLTSLTYGIVHVQELPLEPDRIYIIDSTENNEYFVYDRESVGRASKTLWKLSYARLGFYESLPNKFNITSTVLSIPCFDPKFGENNGAWITLDYSIRVQMSVSRNNIGKLKEAKSPLRTIQNAVTKAARQILPYVPYEDAITANISEDMANWVRAYPEVKNLGLDIDLVIIEVVEGSKKLSEAFNDQFNRLLQAKDKSNIALIYSQMDKDSVTRYLEMSPETPGAAATLTARQRVSDQMLQAILASGIDPLQAYRMTVQSSSKDTPDALSNSVANKAFEQIKSWPELEIPKTKKHSERLIWEKSVLKERIPLWILDTPEENRFVIKLEDNHTLTIIWDNENTIPQVWIDDISRQKDFAILHPNGWDYNKRTIWDIFDEARRLLNASSD